MDALSLIRRAGRNCACFPRPEPVPIRLVVLQPKWSDEAIAKAQQLDWDASYTYKVMKTRRLTAEEIKS